MNKYKYRRRKLQRIKNNFIRSEIKELKKELNREEEFQAAYFNGIFFAVVISIITSFFGVSLMLIGIMVFLEFLIGYFITRMILKIKGKQKL